MVGLGFGVGVASLEGRCPLFLPTAGNLSSAGAAPYVPISFLPGLFSSIVIMGFIIAATAVGLIWLWLRPASPHGEKPSPPVQPEPGPGPGAAPSDGPRPVRRPPPPPRVAPAPILRAPAPPSAPVPTRWVPPGEQVEVAGYAIPGGMVYVGRNLNAITAWRGYEPTLINPTFLDPEAQSLLAEARSEFRRMELHERSHTAVGRRHALVSVDGRPGAGHAAGSAYRLRNPGDTRVRGPARIPDVAPDALPAVFRSLAAAGPADARALAEHAADKHTEKHHVWLSNALLPADYASSQLNVQGALRVIRRNSKLPK